jgi:eukaryotic-like serine/threonine-protein kinase
MGLAPGTRIGSYEIVSMVGAGGMGEVYKARDTRLKRDVAVKALPETFASDPERLARFQREAEVLASLNHPNIAHIHGLEEAGPVRALVMEFVEGEDLAQKIARGPIAIGEALPIARQIAEALEAAHEQGIIHRDLKPANIKVRGDGTVKVLDFGLAKALAPIAVRGRDVTGSPTITSRAMTQMGVILGTAAYMSPEQAKGKPADKRSDIWAFGCVLYEMLTGTRAFEGEDVSETMANVLTLEPSRDRLPGTTTPSIRRLLHRCLEKDPKRRLDSAAVARLEIEEASTEPTSVVQAGVRSGSLWRPTIWAAGGAGVAVLATMMLVGRSRATQLPAMVSTSVLVHGMEFGSTPGVHFAVAPVGRTLVFAGNYGGKAVLYRRDFDQVDPQPIVGTEGGSDVFFSHDGRWLGFEMGSALWKVPVEGGTPQIVFSNQPLRGGTWGGADSIVVGRVGSGLWAVPTTGGSPRQLTTPEQGERHELPQLLPGGRVVVFTILAADKPPRAAVHLLENGETRSLLEGVGARFVSSGHVVFGRQGKLWAIGFDPNSLQTRGTARPVRDDVFWSAAGYPQFAVDAGMLVYLRTTPGSSRPANFDLALVDRKGRRKVLPLEANESELPRLSPTGDRFVVQIGPNRDLWTYDFRQGNFTPLTSNRVIAYSAPVWTPNGKRIAFTTWFDGDVGLGWLPADGSGPVEDLVKGVGMRSFSRTHPVMLPDGSGLILTGLAPGATVEDLLFVPLTGERRRVETLFQAPGIERNPTIAPSGRFIAYNSDESRRDEVYVRPFPNVSSGRWPISTEGGTGPVWTREGREIVYKDSQGRMMAVAVRSDADKAFEHSKPEPLFEVGPSYDSGLDRQWDVTADGNRFLIRVPQSIAKGGTTGVEMIVVQNWQEELKQRVPTR